MEHPEVLLDETDLRAVVDRLAAELSDAYDDGVVLVAVLRGSVPFLADLVRAMTIRATVDFVSLSPYTPGTGRVRFVMDASTNLEGRQVVIVEDIVDTGLTSAFLLGEFARRKPASLSLCTLIDRPARRVVPVAIGHTGLQIEDRFVIGYGLDFEGRYRNARCVAAADLEVLNVDPDAYVEALYCA
ncbi:MAG: phosphoribosyltransferase [Acidimicrobiales bacterium]|jgi:hypoxanthine phosphoribosyltransferase